MTLRQAHLLRDLTAKGGKFLHGAEVRIARVLEGMGYVTVEDNGYMKANNERWFVKPTGKALGK